ncbi:MAG: hypothetical protein AAB353_13540 [Candidatus Hydrogenedentota bacterium]
MHIPTTWAKATGECQTRDNRKLRFGVWGWGDDDVTAKQEAAGRLQRLLQRVQRGEPFPDKYAYGARPLREEILETIDVGGGAPVGMLTRNRYGAVVLNTTNLLFLDIDLPPTSAVQQLKRLFSFKKSDTDHAALAKLRDALLHYGRATFRVYQTAAGFRAIAVDREYDPAGSDAQDLMLASGTDPAFANLCIVQKSFRARLTPKPWRCGCPNPPGDYPRTDDDAMNQFNIWMRKYERAIGDYATCRFIETVGQGTPKGPVEMLIALHDRVTRCADVSPLA